MIRKESITTFLEKESIVDQRMRKRKSQLQVHRKRMEETLLTFFIQLLIQQLSSTNDTSLEE
jgi:hypothetical protein